MKRIACLLTVLAAGSATAQTVEIIPPPPATVVEEEIVEVVPGPPPGRVVEVHEEIVHPAPFDPQFARRHLRVAPRFVDVPAVVEIETVHEIAPRIYDRERNVVVVVEDSRARELPYVTVPVLFKKGTAELLDVESRRTLDEMAAVVHDVRLENPDAVFAIEGHTSTDGPEDFNMKLSRERARRVFDELTQRYGVPPAMLTAHGYGENYPSFPDGSESEMMLDRRVLLVRDR